jgi:hypothetical protein
VLGSDHGSVTKNYLYNNYPIIFRVLYIFLAMLDVSPISVHKTMQFQIGMYCLFGIYHVTIWK